MNAVLRAVLCAGLLSIGGASGAATFTVTSFADSGPGTLRDAIARAEADTTSGSHRIVFASSGTVILTREITWAYPPDLEIDGTGRRVTISGDRRVGLLWASSLNRVTLRRLDLAKALGFALGGTDVRVFESSFQSIVGTAIDTPGGQARVYGSSFHKVDGTAIHTTAGEVVNSTFTEQSTAMDLPNRKRGAVLNFHRMGVTSVPMLVRNVTIHGTRVLDSDSVVLRVARPVNTRGLLTNTLIVNTVGGPNCSLPTEWWWTPEDFSFYDGGGNFIGDDTCLLRQPTSTIGTDALLGPLRDNGGPTLTMQPLSGSPAINGGVATTDTTDQRGYPRRVGVAVDRGAVEVAGSFALTGIFFPIYNWPIFNEAWAGSLVPVRFGLNGYQGMAVFAQGFPTTTAVACGSGPFTPVAELAQSGGGTLAYDTKMQRYQYVLATQPAWKGTCRKLSMKFTDGSSIDTFFRFN